MLAIGSLCGACLGLSTSGSLSFPSEIKAWARETSHHVTGIHPVFPVFFLHSGIPGYPKPCPFPAAEAEDC